MTEETIASPDSLELRSKPLASARLSRKAVFTVIGVLALIMGVVIVNVSKGKTAKAAGQTVKELQPDLIDAKDLNSRVPDFVAPDPPPQVVEPRAGPVRREAVKSQLEDARLADTPVAKFAAQQRTQNQEGLAATSAESVSEEEGPDTGVAGNSAGNMRSGLTGGSRDAMNWGPSDSGAGAGQERSAGGLLRVSDPRAPAEPDLNQQTDKEAFTLHARPSAALKSQLKAPLSAYELQAGTVVPAMLITAINSDLPGEIIAQVAQNVYDTATGQYLLIPQGSRLFGRYDSKVSFGQGRALVTWERLSYPNAYTLDLGGMSGHDTAGQAGLADRVNNHYGRIFGWALLTSALSAGAQLSQPQEANSVVPSNGQVAAAAVGQQMTQLGAQMASRNMQVQPTIEIRKGYRLTVMVNKDIVFPGSYEP
jgi:type IV secretory pathway VirB10-like protein